MNPLTTYINMKKSIPIQVIDLKHQVGYITSRQIQLFE